jgi:hypothetical protein
VKILQRIDTAVVTVRKENFVRILPNRLHGSNYHLNNIRGLKHLKWIFVYWDCSLFSTGSARTGITKKLWGILRFHTVTPIKFNTTILATTDG